MKITTNSSSTETSGPVESQPNDLVTGKKAEPAEVEKPKTFLEQLVEDHRNPVGPSLPMLYEPLTGSKEIQKAVADELVSFIDKLKETPLETITPTPIRPSEDISDLITAGYDFLLEQGKSITDLVFAAPEGAQRALDRTNERIKGDLDIQLTLNPTKEDFLHTVDLLRSPETRSEVVSAQIAFGAEMLIEALPALERAMDSGAARTLDKLTDIGAKFMDRIVIGMIPSPIQVAAPVSTAVTGFKETVAELATPEGIRGASRAFTDPSAKALEELGPGSYFTKKVKIAGDLKGNELGIEVQVTIRKTLEGKYQVAIEGHGDGARGLKDGEIETGVSVGIGSGFKHVYEMDDPRLAAAIGRGDILAGATRLITGEINFTEIEIHWDGEANAGIGPLTGKTNVRAAVSVFERDVELQVTGEIALDFDEFNLVPGVDTKNLKEVWDAVKPDSGFDGKAQVQTTLNSNGEVKVGISLKSVDGNDTYELKGELTINMREAANALGVTVDEFKRRLETGDLEPGTWWQTLPREFIDGKVEFSKSNFDGASPDIKVIKAESGYHRHQELFSISRDGVKGDPEQVLADLQSAKAKEQQLERLRI